MEMDVWAYDKIAVVRSGLGMVESAACEFAISENHVIHLPAGVPHRFTDDPARPMTLMMVCFYPAAFEVVAAGRDAYAEFLTSFPAMEPFDPRDSHRNFGIANGLKLMLFEQSRRRAGSDAVIWCEALELLVMLARSRRELSGETAAPGGRAFNRSLAFLEENFIHAISVQNLADMAGLSYRRYTDIFKARTGRTVNRYLTDLRLDYAVDRLLETGNIQYASLDAGFGDLAHFYRVFKARMGTTPKRYLAQVQATTKR